jgi:hypothetical protein
MSKLRTFLARSRDTLWRLLPPPRGFDVSTLLKPPWIVKPDWPGDSMGWRMGGEQYFFAVRSMYEGLSPAEQAAYDRVYPEPPGWEGYLKHGRRGWRPARR